jgi:hypothetical protein
MDTGQMIDGGVVVEEGSNWTTNGGGSLWTRGYCADCVDVVDANVVLTVVGGDIDGPFRDGRTCIPL